MGQNVLASEQPVALDEGQTEQVAGGLGLTPIKLHDVDKIKLRLDDKAIPAPKPVAPVTREK